ncbi:glycosyltransferase family 4 protein [Pleomorphomonas sp. JP5]|uniref:glycosyltransferase family 4 protein n=1 Tax=Pleomorphomonas sp. JP5 TaxID=2942998 RepID=UPI0020436E64|nr:glycosyltransferase family 4 protein [Pleomorphomonas sp. JP5]MCM5559388.1 glycosyltransferase family 4 protein [Pleomorphomonas sp. JP5]
MNILYLSPYFWPEEIGSAPYCTKLAEHLAKIGHTLDVRAFRPHYPNPSVYLDWADGSRDREMLGSIRIRRTRVSPRGSGGIKERLKNDCRLLFNLLKEVVKYPKVKPDVIIAYVPSIIAVYGAMFLKYYAGVPLYLIVHDIESGLAGSVGIAKNGLLLKAMRLVERFALNSADLVTALTDEMAQELRIMGCRQPIDVIPIWTDPFEELPFPSFSRPVVTYSGNFGKKQNLDQLIGPMKLLDVRRPDIRVVLRGDGSEKERIRSIVLDELKLKNTTFEGLAPASRFGQTLQAAHIHLVPQAPSTADFAIPSKIVSIMAAGRPFICISEPNSSLDRLVTKTAAGLRVEPGNEDALFEAIDKLTCDPDLATSLGRNGRSYVSNHLSAERNLAKFVNNIDFLTGK